MFTTESQQGNPVTLLYHCVKSDGSDLLPTDVQTLKLFVYSTDDNSELTPVGGELVTVSTAIFQTLQSWDLDDIGYNVRIEANGDYFPQANTVYRVEVLVTPTTALPFYLEHTEVSTVVTYSEGGR